MSADYPLSPSRDFIPERRESDAPALLLLVQQVATDMRSLDGNLRNLDNKLSVHMTNETKELADAMADILTKSFPEGDAPGHRVLHEAQIAAMAAKAEFWKKLVFEITKYGLIGLIGWLAFVAWTAFLKGPSK